MRSTRWAVAAPLLLVMASYASGSEVRDDAGMFSADAVRQAESILNKSERQTKVPVTIETISSLRGESPDVVAIRRARQSGHRGVFILLAKAEKKVEVLVSKEWENTFTRDRRKAIHDAFTNGFKEKGLDGGLVLAAASIGEVAKDSISSNGGPIATAPRPVPRGGGGAPGAPAPVPRAARGGGGLLGGIIMLGLIILVVLLVVRLLSGLFRGATGGYGGQAPVGGPPGYGAAPGYGPGYAPRGGGGFWSSMFGGIGGAMAGNWLYDQFSGRHRPYDSGAGGTGGNVGEGGYYSGTGGEPASGGSDWVGGGETTSWGDSGGGGGDWAGGGGGGDWGGGGGGDWGGGGGGGDGGWS
jgi:TPM domain